MSVDYRSSEIVSLADHRKLDEAWLHDRIADDPSLLGLGDVELKDRERRQRGGGRLDLLLQDNEVEPLRRYEVEVQLGATDERHIIRTIEYWDEERKRFPQYDHCAVLVAEDVTSRFLNVINLFNGHIPITAVKLQAIRLGDQLTLASTTVLDERSLGPVEDDEETSEPANRRYWEDRTSSDSLSLIDQMFEIVQDSAPDYEINYTRSYIGLQQGGRADNFVRGIPRTRGAVTFGFKMERDEDLREELEAAGFRDVKYNTHVGRYRLRFTAEDFEERPEEIKRLVQRAYKEGSWMRG